MSTEDGGSRYASREEKGDYLKVKVISLGSCIFVEMDNDPLRRSRRKHAARTSARSLFCLVDLKKGCTASIELHGMTAQGQRECSAAVASGLCQVIATKPVGTTSIWREDRDGLLCVGSAARSR